MRVVWPLALMASLGTAAPVAAEAIGVARRSW